MEPRDLVKVWDAPDNSKLTAKQWSIRLPVHVAAKINALCDIYPRKTKTEIIGDLLATALIQVAAALPSYDDTDRFIAPGPDGEGIFEQYGPRVDFHRFTEKYTKELEQEIESK